uniref:Uncharacterized protein n=2 Tax=Tanacetum cinerariifolium TaxID=118510 RepID=A0A6L2K2C2_TANCI|nr:hypothetical protein [Tanacetum cinerariifolium]
MSYDDIRLIFEKKFNSNVDFPEKTKEQMEEEDSRALKRKTKSSEEKAAKKQKLEEEVEELKKHLQIVPNDEDGVYTEATSLALKMILLVDRRYPLTRFTLDQMLNNVRLEVEEESEVSLELLRLYNVFGGNPKGGKNAGKGKIRTGKLDFDDVYFVKELKFNLFSVSQMCDKKNNFLVIDTECKFDGKADEGFLVGYSVSSKSFRVFNSRTQIVQETLHINFLENKPNVAGSGPTWLFDIDTLTKSMNYQPTTVGNQSNSSAGVQEQFDAEKAGEDNVQHYMHFPLWSSGFKNPQNTDGDVAFEVKEPEFEGNKLEHFIAEFEDLSANNIKEVNDADSLVPTAGQISTNSTNTFSAAGPSNTTVSPTHRKYSYVDTSQYLDDPNMPELEDITYYNIEEDVGAEADFTNLESTITVSPIPTTRVHKDHHEKGIDYKEVFAPVARMEAIRLFLAYASLMGFMVYQMDVKSIFLYGTIKEEDKYVAEILRKFGLTDRKSASTPIDTEKPLLKDSYGEDVDVHTYRLMIGSLMYLTSSRPDIMFTVYACARLQVTLKVSHLHPVKRIFRYLKGKPHLGLWYPKDSPFNLVASSDNDYAGASLDRKSTTGGCQFLGCRLISWQYKKKTIVATSSTEAEYVAAASCCTQVLWIQNQLLNYGLVRNVDSSTKFYMYSRFLQLMIRAQVGVLSSHIIKYSSPALIQKVFANIRRVGKGFSRVDTPLFEGMIVAQQADDVADEGADGVDVDGEIIVNIDADDDVTLKDVAAVEKDVEIEEHADVAAVEKDVEIEEHAIDDKLEPTELKEVVEVVTTAKLMTEVVTTAAATITAATTPITAATITTAPSAARRRKGVVIRDPDETATPAIIIHSEPKSKDKGKGMMVEEPKPLKKQAQIEQDEAYSRDHSDDLAGREKIPIDKVHSRSNALQHTKCIILSPEFKLPDENQVLLRVPRENNMYNIDLKNIVPSRDLTCLFTKATFDEYNLWQRRLGYIDFKTMNKLVKEFEDLFANSINEVNDADSPVPAVGKISTNSTNTFSAAGPSSTTVSSKHGKSSYVDTSQYPDDLNMLELEDITYYDVEEDVGAEADFTNLETTITGQKGCRGIIVRNKARLVAQGHTQEEFIDYEEVFTPVARIEAIRLFLAYASFIGFMVYQMDVESVFLYETIKEEVYVCQHPGFEDPNYPDQVYKVVKALYGLHQAPRAWYETLANYLLENGFQRGKIDQSLFIKSQDKYVAEILRKFGLTDGKSASTPIDTKKPLLKDPDESIECLPNEEIFTELSRMGLMKNVDSSTKFYMYPRFLQLMIRAQVGDLSSHTTKYSSSALTQKVFANMRRVGKEFSRVDTPLFEGMIVAQQVDDVADKGAAGVDVVPAATTEPFIPSPKPTTQPLLPSQELPSTSQVEALEYDKVAQALKIIKLKQRVKKLERKNKLKVYGLKRLRKVRTARRVESSVDTDMDNQEDAFKRGEIIVNIDAYEDVTLKDVAAVEKDVEIEEQADDDELEPTELKEVVEVVTTAKLMTELVTAAAATITAAMTPITADPSAARRRKGVIIRDLGKTATTYIIIHSEPKSKDKGKGIMDDVIEQVQRKEKEDNVVMRNTAGFKMDYFKGMSYDDIRLIFKKKFNSNVAFLEKTKEQMEEEDNRALKRMTESSEEKVAKKQKLDEEVEELKKHLQIVPNDEDGVYTEATPLALKVPVVDYVIHKDNNKPYFKIIRADGTHQLFLSFLSLLRNFNREDLEVL